MESVRHAVWKPHSSDGLALEVGGIDYYQVAAVAEKGMLTEGLGAAGAAFAVNSEQDGELP
jgi:hypothetical protein